MRPDVEALENRVEDLERELRLLASRTRILESRLQNKAILIGDQKGRVKTLRLSDDGTPEVT